MPLNSTVEATTRSQSGHRLCTTRSSMPARACREQVAELDERRHRLVAQPVAADRGIGREGRFRKAIRDDPLRADALEPGTLDCVHARRASRLSEVRLTCGSKRSIEASSLTCQSVCGHSPAYGDAVARTTLDSSRPPL
jgi:hypothetical protein